MSEYSIYKVFYEDGEEFEGGTISAPKWSRCSPDKGIRKVEMNLPYGDKIILSNYDKFNFFIGATKFINSGELVVNHLFALGCKNGLVTSYRITLSSKDGGRYRVGDMTVRQFPFGKEGIGRTSTSGWKKGIEK